MRFMIIYAALAAFCVAFPILAQGQYQSQGGFSAESLSSSMSDTSYSKVKGDYWWNATTRSCLRVPINDGRAADILVVRATICSQAARHGTGPGKGCPVGTPESEFDIFPDCRHIMAGR